MDYDAAWKRLFGLPIMVEHLLCGFAAPVADRLELATLRDLSASWAAADAEQRHGDAVWRADYADGSGRSVVVLLEFQSGVDRAMAVRVQRYATMARETLTRAGRFDADGDLRLLPVVVHSGRRRWTAPGAARAVDVTADGEVLIPPPGVYLLLDAVHGAPDHRPERNLVSTLFEFDSVAHPAEVVGPMRALMEWLPGTGAAQREVLEAFVEWLATTMPRLFPDSDAAVVVERLRRDLPGREAEMTQLAERVKEWEAEWLRQGIERGLAEERELLCRQAARKFDALTARRLARRLDEVTDAAGLAEVGDWIIDYGAGAELLGRMDYDAAWKRLFDLPIMVEHLLRGFAAPVADLLELATLRELSASWAAADVEQRRGDAVWRADYADGSGRSVVVVLEFQSGVDRAMAVRMQRYATMAREALTRAGRFDADGELRMLPVVVHSGRKRWTAPGAARAVEVTANDEVLIPLPGVYLLLDAVHGAPDHRPERNLVSTLFELDSVAHPAEVVGPMRALMEWLPGPGAAQREVLEALAQWLATAMPRLFPDSDAAVVVEGLRRDLPGREAEMTQLAEQVVHFLARAAPVPDEYMHPA